MKFRFLLFFCTEPSYPRRSRVHVIKAEGAETSQSGVRRNLCRLFRHSGVSVGSRDSDIQTFSLHVALAEQKKDHGEQPQLSQAQGNRKARPLNQQERSHLPYTYMFFYTRIGRLASGPMSDGIVPRPQRIWFDGRVVPQKKGWLLHLCVTFPSKTAS